MKYLSRDEISEKDSNIYPDNYPDVLKNLLYYRNIRNTDDINRFLNPNYEKDLHNPFLMIDMDKAVSRMIEAIDKNEKVLIYSDYDADGVPGAVALSDFFRRIKFSNFDNYIPHRHNEGYGLHMEAVEEFKERGFNLIVTIDCGIGGYLEVQRAVDLGMDVIITDHHETNGKIPNALAVINPKRGDCNYPFKELCGAGVIFKFIQALIEKGNFNIYNGTEKWLLDMVGIATLSDMVPLVGENRVLSHFGLKVLKVSRRPGLKKLFKKINLKQYNLSEDDVGFSISPRINAASRMGIPEDAFNLLFSEDDEVTSSCLLRLEKTNNERKGVVASLVKEIKKTLEKRNFNLENDGLIVLGNPKWRPSLLGLVANSLAENYNCPVFLWGRDGGDILKGSCRSDGKLNLVEFMERASEVFDKFGGHKMAGGFSISNEKVHYIEKYLREIYMKELKNKKEQKEEVSFIDGKLSLKNVNQDFFSLLELLSPFGMENSKPVFMFENLTTLSVKRFGKDKGHLEVIFKDLDGYRIKAIKFFIDDSLEEKINSGNMFNVVANIERESFNGSRSLRLRILDVI